MPKAYILKQTGSSEVLKIENIPELKAPGPNQVLVRHTAIGLSFMDIEYRKGILKAPLPCILGSEAVGVVEAVGSGVDIKPGTRVGYATTRFGAYTEKRIVDISLLVGIPESITDVVAAGGLAKGLTAHYLLHRTFNVKKNDFILVNAAAGATGQLICQWGNSIGARVIGVVGSEGKVSAARNNGCLEVIVSTKGDFSEAVAKITNTFGVAVAFDPVGKDSFIKSIRSLSYMGLLVSYGQSSGAVPPFSISNLSKKGIFLTCPSLFLYKSNRMELVLSATEVFNRIQSGDLNVKIDNTYSFEEIPAAHDHMESRKTIGASVVVLK